MTTLTKKMAHRRLRSRLGVMGLFLVGHVLAQTAIAAASEKLLPSLAFDSSSQEILHYKEELDDWGSHPEALNKLSPGQLIDLSTQIGGISLKQTLPKPEWVRLRQSETELMGLVVVSLCRRLDPGIDITRPMHGRYPPYDDVAAPSELHDDVKRRTYDAQARVAYSEDVLENDQIILHKQLDRLIWIVNDYLAASYADQSNEAKSAIPILRNTGLTPEMMTALIKTNNK